MLGVLRITHVDRNDAPLATAVEMMIAACLLRDRQRGRPVTFSRPSTRSSGGRLILRAEKFASQRFFSDLLAALANVARARCGVSGSLNCHPAIAMRVLRA